MFLNPQFRTANSTECNHCIVLGPDAITDCSSGGIWIFNRKAWVQIPSRTDCDAQDCSFNYLEDDLMHFSHFFLPIVFHC